MVAVPACSGLGKDVSGSRHVVGSGTADPVSGSAVLIDVGNMVAVSACGGIRSTRGTSLRDVSWSRDVVESGAAGPVGGAALLTGVGNMGGSGNRGASDLGDKSTAEGC